MEKLSGKTSNIIEENIAKLKELFPEVFTEGKVNFEVLKDMLGEHVDDQEERYQFTWNGKNKARLLAQTPSTGTLRPCREESVDWDSTANIFIEGDNLEVLKLLQKSYYKKVKMIYIDPPYNTGKDFVYKDNFRDNIRNYKEITGQMDGQGRNLSNNPETSGRYHTDWLNMMYPRLKLTRNLLKNDGVIFISIDDGEQANLKKMCDELFGEENFVCYLNWQTKKGSQGMQTKNMVVTNHEYILVYAKQALDFSFLGEERSEQGFSNPDNDPRGLWKRQYLQRLGQNLPVRTIKNPENGMVFSFETPYTQEHLDSWLEEGRIIFSKNEDSYPARKEFLNEYKTNKQLVTSLGLHSTKASTEKLYGLFNKLKIFTNPKPDTILSYLLEVTTQANDLILDFFCGSGTTAHAVMQQNFKDNGFRKFIMVQLPEACSEKSDATKVGCKTIADIAKERIRRAAMKIQEENPTYSGDLGFKVFKLDSTNIKPWEVNVNLSKKTLQDFISNIKDDRHEEDVLHEILLKYGFELTLPIDELKMENGEWKKNAEDNTHNSQRLYSIGMGALIIYFSDCISLEAVEGIAQLKAELKPEIMRVVFKDSGFKDDVIKTNAVQLLKQAGIADVRSL